MVFHPVRAVFMVSLGVVLGVLGFYAFSVTRTFQSVASEDFDPGGAREAILQGVDDDDDDEDDDDPLANGLLYDEWGDVVWWLDEEVEAVSLTPQERHPTAFGVPIPDNEFDAYLLLGVDESGSLADTIILVLEAARGGRPIMVSLPRDLWVWNACRNRFTRLNEGLGGCRGIASGSELMAIMVEDYTGIQVDHLARVNFDGFSGLVDALGGITVCVDHPSRDPNAGLNITEPGCNEADGDTALAWVRSRNTEQLIDGEWRTIASSDFARQRRQQDVLFQLAGKASQFSSPTALTQTLGAVASTIRLNSKWTFGDAVGVGWRHRGLTPNEVIRFEIDVRDFTTSQGARVLLPRVTFTQQLSRVFNLPG